MINMTVIELTCRAHQPLRLQPFMGSAWRGAFGHVLRQHACLTGQPSCDNCPLAARCVYHQIFEPGPPATAAMLAGIPDAPRPYVMCADPGGAIDPDNPYRVEIALFGQAGRHARLVRNALEHAAVRINPELKTCSCDIRVQPLPRPSETPDQARIQLSSVLILRIRGRIVRPETFRFPSFFSNVLRRISLLASIYDAAVPVIDARALVRHAATIRIDGGKLGWKRLARYSSRQNKLVPLNGLTGEFSISGDLAPLWPWLWYGQWLHAGRGADMGLGGYRLQ